MSTALALPNTLAEDNLDLVDLVMRQTRKSWHSLEHDDVIGAAFEGLVSAANTFNPEKNDSFRAWASTKIKWGILDFVRKELRQGALTDQLEVETPGGDVVERPVKPVLKLIPKEPTPCKIPSAAVCVGCKHPFEHHHERFGCMFWSRRFPGAGYCQCEGMRVR